MRVLFALGLLGLSAVIPATAQGACEPLAAEGIEQMRAEDWRAALSSLSAAVETDSTCVTPGGELAGDRLGRVQLVLGDVDGALATWDRTLTAVGGGKVPGREALVGVYLDALVRLGYATGPKVAAVFRELLLPTQSRPPDDSPYWRLLAQVASVVPSDVAAEAFVAGDWRRGVASGQPLAVWWLSEDPFPGTTPNERVEEHLLRVSEALADYPNPGSAEGYDDRGRLFVRFGAPQVARRLAFDMSELVLGLSRLNVGVSRQSFPSNEVWTYGSIDEAMVYILVARNEVYRIGQTEDLLPTSLRSVTGRGERERRMMRAALLAMRYVYGELATTSIEYGNAWGDTVTILEQTASPFRNPNAAIVTIQRSVSMREAERTREREAREPSSVSQVAAQTPRVAYEADAARFLDGDGRTRLDLMWGLRPGSYPDLPGSAVLTGSVVERPGTAQQTISTTVLQSLTPGQVAGVDSAPHASASAACGAESCAPVVQLSLFAADPEGQPVERMGTSVWRVPVQEPLRSGGLEMSDIRPFDPIQNEPLLVWSITPGTPLSVYFEAYGFEDGTGSSRVTIEYEVVRRRRGTLLRRTRETPTSGDLRLFDRGATTEQYLILNTADWADADEVDVRITVRDERTGEAVERARTFEVDRARP